MKFNGKSIIVDADVARASGLSEHPVSKNSRDLLQTLLKIRYKVGFCPILLDEWKKHRSLFAKQWLTSMTARKLVVRLSPTPVVHAYIDAAEITKAQKEIANKDAHVVDAALVSDKFIASNDKKARDVFCRIANSSTSLRTVIWAIPSEDGEQISAILSDGSDIPPRWKLTLT